MPKTSKTTLVKVKNSWREVSERRVIPGTNGSHVKGALTIAKENIRHKKPLNKLLVPFSV